MIILRLILFPIVAVFLYLGIQQYIDVKIKQYKEEYVLINKELTTSKEIQKQLDCLALNIYKEAGYEPFEGKVAVAQVTLNRVKDKNFPNNVCGVVYQKNKFNEKIVCQFSWYCDSKHRLRPVGKESYKESQEVAKKVLLENFTLPSLTDALYYHADYVNPNWKFERIIKIGKHIFYKPKD